MIYYKLLKSRKIISKKHYFLRPSSVLQSKKKRPFTEMGTGKLYCCMTTFIQTLLCQYKKLWVRLWNSSSHGIFARIGTIGQSTQHFITGSKISLQCSKFNWKLYCQCCFIKTEF